MIEVNDRGERCNSDGIGLASIGFSTIMWRLLQRRRERAAMQRRAGAYETIVYTRNGCCLCKDAFRILAKHGFQPKFVDIDGDSRLVELYGDQIPVVVMNGKVRFRGRVNESLLRRLLRQR